MGRGAGKKTHPRGKITGGVSANDSCKFEGGDNKLNSSLWFLSFCFFFSFRHLHDFRRHHPIDPRMQVSNKMSLWGGFLSLGRLLHLCHGLFIEGRAGKAGDGRVQVVA